MNEIEEQLKAEVESKYGEALTTSEATDKYSFKSFLAPIVFVTRKSDGVDGTLEFTHRPRFYFKFAADEIWTYHACPAHCRDLPAACNREAAPRKSNRLSSPAVGRGDPALEEPEMKTNK